MSTSAVGSDDVNLQYRAEGFDYTVQDLVPMCKRFFEISFKQRTPLLQFKYIQFSICRFQLYPEMQNARLVCVCVCFSSLENSAILVIELSISFRI